MVKKKQQPDLVIENGSHLLVTTNNHTGEKTLSWNWDALLKEVQEATKLVPVTEAKVKKARAKKEDVAPVADKPKRGRKKKTT